MKKNEQWLYSGHPANKAISTVYMTNVQMLYSLSMMGNYLGQPLLNHLKGGMVQIFVV